MRMSHSSFASSPDENGNCYSLSIDPSAKTKGTLNMGLDGMSFGTRKNTCPDFRDRSLMIAKFPRRKRATEKWADLKVRQARECQDWGRKFNHAMLTADKILTELSGSYENDDEDLYFNMSGAVGETRCSKKISFLSLQKANLDSVATLQFSKWKRVKGEVFVFEDKLDNFTKFIDHEGISVVPPPNGRHLGFMRRRNSSCSSDASAFSSSSSIDEDHHQVLHAFIHFFFCYTDGKKIACNFRGSFDEDTGYRLTTPWVYSVTGKGSNDKGLEGMENVINNHVCNKYCKHLPSMQDLFSRLTFA